MKRLILFIWGCVVSVFAYAEYNKSALRHIADSIKTHSYRAYELTDATQKAKKILVKEYGGLKKFRSKLGDYFTYHEGTQLKAVFLSKSETPQVEHEFVYQKQEEGWVSTRNSALRDLNQQEILHAKVLKQTKARVGADPTLYYIPKKEKFEWFILPFQNKISVFLFTFSKDDKVLFGRDFQIDFDLEGNFLAEKKLSGEFEEVLLSSDVDLDYKELSQRVLKTSHQHNRASQFITLPDLCLLYYFADQIEWQIHIVVAKYISTYDMKKDSLIIETFDQYKKKHK